MNENYTILTKRIMRRYMIYWLILFGSFLFFLFISRLILTRFLWHSSNPYYQFFKTLERLSPYFIMLGLIIGTLILMRQAIKKSLLYADMTLTAAKQLSAAQPTMVHLPPDLIDVQNELNVAREYIIRNSQQAAEAVQRKNDLIMYLAHDLKTPLASVIGYLNLLKDTDDLPADVRNKYLDITLDKANRLEDLMNEFFDISRFNLSAVKLNLQQVNITRMLEQTTFEFMPMFQDKGMTCDLKINAPVQMNCDPNKLQRVFDNILRNALAYSNADSPVTISARFYQITGTSWISLSFANHGPTIPPAQLNLIFEQFYRVDESRSSTGGAGLGLAIAKQIVELHGGTIGATSASELTTFTVNLPIVAIPSGNAAESL